MPKVGLFALAAATLIGAGAASAQPDQLAHDQEMKAHASAAHAAAVKSGDKAAIARTDAQLRMADEDIYEDKQEASWKVPANASAALRAADAELIAAKEESGRAYASGNQAAIDAARKRVRAAYQHRWDIAHGKG